MNKESDSDNKALAEGLAPESGKSDALTARRKFTRQAIVGSGVLFSLGNRPAWSQTDCISDSLHTSWVAGTHSSHDPNDYSDYTLEIDGEWCKPDADEQAAGFTFDAQSTEVFKKDVADERDADWTRPNSSSNSSSSGKSRGGL